MSDLDILFPHSELRLGADVFTLRPLPLRLIPQFFRVAAAWEAAIASGGTVLDFRREVEAYDLLGYTISRAGSWVRSLPETVQYDVVAAAIAVNRDLFEEPDEEPSNLPRMEGPNVVRARARKQELDWGEAVARLVSGGHSWTEIQEMTLPQIHLLLKGMAKVERDRHASDVVAAAFSMADGNATKKYLQELARA